MYCGGAPARAADVERNDREVNQAAGQTTSYVTPDNQPYYMPNVVTTVKPGKLPMTRLGEAISYGFNSSPNCRRGSFQCAFDTVGGATAHLSGQTLGSCVGGDVALAVHLTGSACRYYTPKGGPTTTVTGGYGISSHGSTSANLAGNSRIGGGLSLGPSWSNAKTPNDISGWSDCFEVGGAYGAGANGVGCRGRTGSRPISTTAAGVYPGVGAWGGNADQTYTWLVE